MFYAIVHYQNIFGRAFTWCCTRT